MSTNPRQTAGPAPRKDELMAILDALPELVYVTDPGTDEVVFVNRRLAEALGRDPRGEKCFRVFQGLDERCPFCTNDIILGNPGSPHTWEHHNPVLGRDYQCTDSIVRWPDGRDLRMEVAVDITARRRAEQELAELNRELEQRVEDRTAALAATEELSRSRTEELAALLETIPVAVWIAFDPKGERMTGNRAANRLYEAGLDENVSAGALGGKQDRARRFFRDGRELLPDELPLQRALATGEEVTDCELEVELPSGRRRVILGNARPLFDSEGRVRAGIAAFLDVTDRQLAEAAVEESEVRLRSLAENVPSVLMRFDREQRVVYLSPQAEQATGRPVEHFLGRTNREAGMPADLCDRWEEAIERVFRTGETAELEFEFPGPEGARTFFLRLAPEQDRDGQVRHVLGISTEITVLKRAEEAVAKSEARYHRLVRDVPIGIYRTTPDGRILMANPCLVEMLGFDSAEELLAVNVEESGLTAGYDRAGFRRQVEREGEVVGLESRWRRKDGSALWVRENASLVRDENGRVTAYEGTVEDITERKDIEQQLLDSMKELRRSNAELEQFAYVASHDLRAPLRMVSSYVTLLAERYREQLDRKGERYVEHAVNGAKRMSALIDDLLAYARVTSRPVGPEEFDAGEAAREALIIVADDGDDRARVDVGELPRVTAVRGRLVQVFQNLLANAFKFRAGDPPRIEVTGREADGGWEFAVRDNGIGIEPRHAERIFRLFQRLHSEEEYPGTGMGLALCRKIVESHGGRIWCEPAPDRGTVFRFTIARPHGARGPVGPESEASG